MGRKLNFGETMCWLRQFLVPVIVFSVIAVFTYIYSNSLILVIFIVVLGIVLGVIYAEWIRKKYGNCAYYDSLYHTKVRKEDE